eukprot:scaffold23186_cov161-Skeletonema_marinoi.AAC.1
MAQFLVQIFSTDVNGWDHWTIWTRFGFKNLIYHKGDSRFVDCDLLHDLITLLVEPLAFAA